MSYRIYKTEMFEKVYGKLDNNDKDWIINQIYKLKENLTGKPLRFNWFREKKYLNKRLYFLVNEESKIIILVAFGNKK